jgi:hypothetical protein
MDLVIENVGRRSKTWGNEGDPTDVGDSSLNGFERNALFWNRGDGRFEDVAYLTGADRIEDGRALAVADFDRDGRLDMLVQNLDRPVALLMGKGEAGRWLQVELEGTRSNRGAIGAVVIAHQGDRKQMQQVAVGSGFLSSSSPVLHFGLGESSQLDALEIRWPSGTHQWIRGVEANQRLEIREEGLASAAAPR